MQFCCVACTKNNPTRDFMRKILLSLTTVSAIAVAASLAPANAMTVGTASGIQTTLADTSLLEDTAYVCRHRYYSSRRVCSWRSNHYRWRWHRYRW